jgi:hypothetical protein
MSMYSWLHFNYFKGIGSIVFLKKWFEIKFAENYTNHLKCNNYDVCTAVARCFPSNLDAIVLENINICLKIR